MAAPRLSIIVPVFNTGEHLRTRAFPSLARLPHFEQIQVLLVDDGSTYPQTRSAVRELAAAHPHVQACFLDSGGSGSASRPRNTGIDLAEAEYLGFLDPDDEFLGAGPWPLVEALQAHPSAQLAIGQQHRIYADRQELVNNASHYTERTDAHGLWPAGGEVLTAARFRPSNLSSFVVRTAWLRETGLRQVVGAAGQDSLFFRQLFAAATAFVASSEVIYAYHAETPGSMVNTVNAEYFAKCLLRERAQAEWLRSAGLFDAYVASGFERAFAWYLPRLRRVPKDQRAEARAVLRTIAELYVDPQTHRWRYPEAMAFFKRPAVPSLEGLKPLSAVAARRARDTALAAVAAGRRVSSSVRTRRRLDP
ncbi:glycosyltransferase family 2 protein [Nesterenkonia sphaerica]|uniref:Glycosyltransferase family 2 protein n=1 Tax=Nesterenkonia sphaerica TaxID=1804988 RepID=A0A5R9ABD5_9MICC|nr:glycosyltransferase family 2 protein [Nesterenkonia sphaerica]TLP75315.1 glycosyltransferase family 2 protein [Nesterenkonia sphaerica]